MKHFSRVQVSSNDYHEGNIEIVAVHLLLQSNIVKLPRHESRQRKILLQILFRANPRL